MPIRLGVTIVAVLLLLVIVSVLLAILFWASPNAKQGGVKWVSPGGVVAVLLWLVISGLFAFYLTTFAEPRDTRKLEEADKDAVDQARGARQG